ncbi:MAG TPA: NTP transferase domain-containing protein, partial [Actinomycetota bacterium]|nr:NTP transferase domain-containing protein [Actinomycetota bacterium]
EPKTLLPLDGHEPLMSYLLAGLQRASIAELLVITGFKPDRVESYVTSNWSGNVSFVRNARFASWGNFHSVRIAIDASPGDDLLLINSDIVVHPDVFTRVTAEVADVVLAVERRDVFDGEEMRVTVADERVVAIGKDIDPRSSHGEFAGVSLLGPDAGELYTRIASALEWRAETSLYYEDVYARMLSEIEVRTAWVAPGEYAEVDAPEDIARATAVLDAHPEAWRAALDEPA